MSSHVAIAAIDLSVSSGTRLGPPTLVVGLASVALVSWVVGMGFFDELLQREDESSNPGPAGTLSQGDLSGAEPSGIEGIEGLDDLGGMDDLNDGSLDQLGGGGDSAAELEPRIDDLESEVANISSTISTVRSENEEIVGKVESMEENVRKLLEIYEMVTRGANPFVDDHGSDFDPDSLGLFEAAAAGSSDDTDAEQEEMMNADSDSFFDDEFDLATDGKSNVGDSMPDALGESFGLDGIDEADEESDTGGTTFTDLKSEYESDQPDSKGDEVAVDIDWGDNELDEDIGSLDSPAEPSSTPDPTSPSGDPADRHGGESVPDSEDDGSTGTATDAPEPDRAQPSDAGFEFPADSDDEGEDNAILGALPNGLSSEMLVLEWMDYLRDNADTAETLRAIEYYENIDWISDKVAEDLKSVVVGLPDDEPVVADGGSLSNLSIEQHTRSLQFIAQLSGDSFDPRRISDWPRG